MLRDAKTVIVNATSVKEDICKFFPNNDCEVFNLPFSAAPGESWFEVSDKDIVAILQSTVVFLNDFQSVLDS